MITKNLKFVVVALGILLSFALPASASAAPHIVGNGADYYCTAPCAVKPPVTLDPEGSTLSVDWLVDANYIRTTTCSDPNTSSCQQSATFQTLGTHYVRAQFEYNGARQEDWLTVQVVKQEDLPDDQLEINLPERISTPTTFSVCSRRKQMTFSWKSSREFEGAPLTGYGTVTSRFSQERGCWIHTGELRAPEGNLRVFIYLSNPKDSDAPKSYTSASDSYVRDTKVTRSAQPPFSDFASFTGCEFRSRALVTEASLVYLALKPTVWSIQLQVLRKVRGDWRVVWSRTRGGSTVPDDEQYAVKRYGHVRKALRGKKLKKLRKSSRKRKAKVIARYQVKDKTTDRTIYKPKPFRKKIPVSGCKPITD